MAKVKMLTSMAGLTFSYVPGDIVEVTDDAAKAWDEAGIAQLVDEPKKKASLKKDDAE